MSNVGLRKRWSVVFGRHWYMLCAITLWSRYTGLCENLDEAR